jgi:hypothetical protein
MHLKSVHKRQVPGFPQYIVTSIGEVYHERLQRKLKVFTTSLGHDYVVLYQPATNGIKAKGIKLSLSRLVAILFVPGKSKINNRVLFKNKNRHDPAATNLFWGSHQLACQRGNTGKHVGLTGENNPNSKLTKKQVARILSLYATGNSSHRLLALKYKVTATAIYKILKRQVWKAV